MVVNFWQEYFLFHAKGRDVTYFINFASLKKYLSEDTNHNNNATYLLDYKGLGEKLTGVTMIKEFGLNNAYLITNYAEDIKQDEIKSLTIKLVPKTMLQVVLQHNFKEHKVSNFVNDPIPDNK